MIESDARVTISSVGSGVQQQSKASPFLCQEVALVAAGPDQSPFAVATLPEDLAGDLLAAPRDAQRDRPNSAAVAPVAAAAARPAAAVVRTCEDVQDVASSSNTSTGTSTSTKKKRVTWSAKLFTCCYVARASTDGGDDTLGDMLPRTTTRGGLTKQASAAYSDADWFDARSEFSSALSGCYSDQAAKLEELAAMLKDGSHLLGPVASMPRPLPALAPVPSTGPHIPEPPLAFAEPGLVYVPLPAVTGFAAWWERDEARSTAHPSPIDLLMNASALAVRSHASIPGIWLQETDTGFSVTVKPRFLPPGLPRYTEMYDKTNATEPSWSLRRDLRLGSTAGNIYFTACGMLVLRAKSRPMWGSGPDFISEEYLRLEEGGAVLVDRMCCLEVKTGKRATQYVVGKRHDMPPKGSV